MELCSKDTSDRIRVSVAVGHVFVFDTDTCNYGELCHFLKIVVVSMCLCRVFIGIKLNISELTTLILFVPTTCAALHSNGSKYSF